MSEIKIDKSIKQDIVKQLQGYIESELDFEIGEFDAEFLLDFISNKAGKHFYNQGLYDAQALFSSRVETVTEEVFQLEK